MKLMNVLAIAVTALTLVGCGKANVPANTVAAWYLDVDNSAEGISEVAEKVFAKLPESEAKEARAAFDQVVAYKKDYGIEWVLATVGLEKNASEPQIAVVVRCDYAAKGKDGSLEDLLLGMAEKKSELKGCTVAEGVVDRSAKVAFVAEKYLIAANDVAHLEKMIALYRDGEGETSDAFDGLTDLGGDTFLRIQTAEVGEVVDYFDLRKKIEAFGTSCEDEDLAEMVLDIGNVTLDFDLDGEVFASRLTVEAGSDDLADVFEGVFRIGAFANRVASAAMIGFGSELGSFCGEIPSVSSDLVKALVAKPEIDRDGTEVSAYGEIDLDKVIGVFDELAKVAEKSL